MENLIEKLLLNKYLTVHTVNKMKLDKNYIKEQLIKVGLKKGDSVLVHSQLLKVGIPEEDVFDLGKYYLDIILEIIGDDGELVLPAFTYSYCKNKVFSPLKDMSSVSSLANTCIRNHIGYRTLDPIFSYVIVNPESAEQRFSNVSFDLENGMAGYLSKKNAKYLMIGDLIYFTLLLACEQQLHTYNRFMKKFSGITKINDTEIHSDCYYYCRRYCDNTILDLSKLTRIVVDPLVSAGKVKYESFGNSHLYYCTDVNIMMDAYKESLNRDLFELLKGPALSESDLIKIDPEKDELDINRVNYKIVKL
mgnify:FL=1